MQQLNLFLLIIGTHIEFIELITTTETKTIPFSLSKVADSNLGNKVYGIIKHIEI